MSSVYYFYCPLYQSPLKVDCHSTAVKLGGQQGKPEWCWFARSVRVSLPAKCRVEFSDCSIGSIGGDEWKDGVEIVQHSAVGAFVLQQRRWEESWKLASCTRPIVKAHIFCRLLHSRTSSLVRGITAISASDECCVLTDQSSTEHGTCHTASTTAVK